MFECRHRVIKSQQATPHQTTVQFGQHIQVILLDLERSDATQLPIYMPKIYLQVKCKRNVSPVPISA